MQLSFSNRNRPNKPLLWFLINLFHSEKLTSEMHPWGLAALGTGED